MSRSCATPQCDRKFRALCDCCKQNLCLQHLSEHNVQLVSQLMPLTNELNKLGDRLESLKLYEIVVNGYEKLKLWQKDCHEKIDRLFEKKCKELDRLVTKQVDQQREKILHMQLKIAKLISEQEATRDDIDMMSSAIRQIGTDLHQIDQTSVQINTRSLVLDDNYILIRQIDESELVQSTLASVYRTLSSPIGSYVELATNEKLLLVHQKPNLCLVDLDMNIKNQIFWEHDSLWDMCWSSTLDRFIVINEDNIFLVNDKSMAIESVYTDKKQKWMSCTCSETSLFLSTDTWGSTIVQFRLTPTISLVKEWKSPATCSQHERIDGLCCNDNNICAMIVLNNKEKSLRIELRHSTTLKRIWSYVINGTFDQSFVFRCCSLKYGEWLLADCENRRLLHITKDGDLKLVVNYHEIPYRVKLIGSDILAVSTQKGINFHKI